MDPLMEVAPMLFKLAQEKDKRNEEQHRLREYGIDRILQQQTPTVPTLEGITDKIVEQAKMVRQFMLHCPYQQLAGVAANQLSVKGQRLMLDMCCVRIKGGNDNSIIAFSPQIVERVGPTFQSREGCLTWPGREIMAMRHTAVKIRFRDVEGMERRREAEGFEALVWQHEINHLDGIEEDVRAPVKLQGPNEPCQCGKVGPEGKPLKFKKCCGR